MASCNMCRNGLTALGRDCPNSCKPAGLDDVIERVNELAHRSTTNGKDQMTCRDALGELVRLRRLIFNREI